MALYPGAIQRLIPRHNKVPIKRYRRMNLHVAVSEAKSLAGYFETVADCSHFYVRKDGTVEQYIDTRFESHADYQGNDSTLSVETQGGLTNANSEPWTEAQVQSIAKLWAWARDTHNIPDRLASGTATIEDSVGLSWHRLGVLGHGTTVNIKYSKSVGKICPGDAKIAQIPRIYQLASKPQTAPVPEEDIMATLDELRQLIREEVGRAVWNHKFGPAHSPVNGTEIPEETAGARLREVRKAATYTNKVAATADPAREA